MTTKLEQAALQALDALEELFHSNSTKVAVEKYNTAHTSLREALSEQAEQEPVAFQMICPRCKVDRVTTPCPNRGKPGDCPMIATAQNAATNPVRTKDLTDDEINKISSTIANTIPANMTVEDWKRSFARAVIAADRKKNK